MSRSYKKTPVCKVSSNYDKRLANRKIRRTKYKDDIPNGCSYKRYYPQYDICDMWSRRTWNQEADFINHLYYGGERWWSWARRDEFENEDGSPNLKKMYNHWRKYYRMK